MLQPVPEQDAFARRQAEGETGGPAAPAIEPAPGNEQGIDERPRRVKGDDPRGALGLTGQVMHLAGRARRDHDLVLDVQPFEILELPVTHPDQVGGDVGGHAALGQRGAQVGVGGDLLAAGLDLPQLALDPFPCLAAGEADDGRVGQAVFLGLVEDILGLEQVSGVFGSLAHAGKRPQRRNVVEGRLPRRFADDFVHLARRQECPLQPGRHLGSSRDQKRAEQGQGDRQSSVFLRHGLFLDISYLLRSKS